ncbi:MAG TPA: HDOD domain-containing protein [Polyangia bacterium]|nr:HDOD domain-containing protein [Polyangia bacterium]
MPRDVQVPDPAAPVRAAVAERLAAGALELPLLPQVASQVVSLAGSDKADAGQLSGLIHRDPALAGHVLRIANSPAYMPKMPIVSLQQAVARLGLNLVTEIALAASMQSGIFRVPGYEAVLKQLWRHSLASGAFAKEIARVRRSNVESAFLSGLLHAVGKPALLQLCTDLAKSLRVELAKPDVFALLDEHHAQVGILIAQKWGLPKPVTAAIAHYADYKAADAFSSDAMITCLADRLATDLLVPGAFDDTSIRQHAVFADLNLYPDDVTALLGKKEMVLKIVEAMTV